MMTDEGFSTAKVAPLSGLLRAVPEAASRSGADDVPDAIAQTTSAARMHTPAPISMSAPASSSMSELMALWRSLPWIIVCLAVAIGAIGAYYAYERHQLTRDELSAARAELTEAKRRTAEVEQSLMSKEAELARSGGMPAASSQEKSHREALASKLSAAIPAGKVTPHPDGQVVISFPASALFASTDGLLSQPGKKALERLAAVVTELPAYELRVQGRSNALPKEAMQAGFSSSFELSAARALAVVRHLQDRAKLAPERLMATALSAPAKRKGASDTLEIVLVPAI